MFYFVIKTPALKTGPGCMITVFRKMLILVKNVIRKPSGYQVGNQQPLEPK